VADPELYEDDSSTSEDNGTRTYGKEESDSKLSSNSNNKKDDSPKTMKHEGGSIT
jgi:hypothetical protein